MDEQMFDPKIGELQEQLCEINDKAHQMQAAADAEDRQLTPDETAEVNGLFAQFEQIESDIKRREKMVVQTQRIAESTRKTPMDSAEPAGGEIPTGPPIISGMPMTEKQQQNVKVLSHSFERSGTRGFNSFGDFARHVMIAGLKGGSVDPRLIAAAPTTYGTEGVGADGGYAVPPDFRTTIENLIAGEESLLSRTRQVPTSSNNLAIPTIEATPWGTSGIQAYWEAEAAQMSQSKPAVKKVNLELNKLTALVGMTEELREDAVALSSLLPQLAAETINQKLNLAIVQGTGAGTPLGLLNAASTVSVAKESGQSADTVVYRNIVNMWARLYGPYRQNAVWLIHQDVEPQLQQMYLPTGSTGVAAYMPPGGLSTSPYATIMGRPVIPVQACETVGDVGDIILWAPDRYLTAVKSGGIRQEMSIHLWFDYDVDAFRFILRVAGQPMLSAAISPRDGSNTLSSQVTLAARA